MTTFQGQEQSYPYLEASPEHSQVAEIMIQNIYLINMDGLWSLRLNFSLCICHMTCLFFFEYNIIPCWFKVRLFTHEDIFFNTHLCWEHF